LLKIIRRLLMADKKQVKKNVAQDKKKKPNKRELSTEELDKVSGGVGAPDSKHHTQPGH
jgi:bacteriocin-like protein